MTIIIITLVIYISMVFSVKYRTAIATLGTGILLVYTTLFQGYSYKNAFTSFPLEIVLLILTLALFSKIFETNGFLTAIGDKLLELSKGKKIFITIMLPFIMYMTSLFMNNLSVILIFTFISLTIIRKFDFPVIPILVAGLISSNIGGCPLPWADTPAVIITLYSDFTLIDFLSKLLIPCTLIEILLIIYIFIWCKYINRGVPCNLKDQTKYSIFFMKPPPPIPDPPDINFNMRSLHHEPPPHIKMLLPKSKFIRMYLPLITFILFIISICIVPFTNLSTSYICMFFLGFILIFLSKNPEEILNSLSVIDSLVFISTLFIISGVLKDFGILTTMVTFILSFTGTSKILILLSILFCAFIISTFLSAGPAAATILPMCIQLLPIIGSNFIFVALALGILAGSSMLPWSATGGPIMFAEVRRYLHHNIVCEKDNRNIMNIYDLKSYICFSIPFSLIILLFSSLYLILYVII